MWSPRLKNVESKVGVSLQEIRKITKIVATCLYFGFKAKMHQKSNFCYSAPPNPLVGVKAAYF